jgi:hypothetical protein
MMNPYVNLRERGKNKEGRGEKGRRWMDFGFKHFIKFICVPYKPDFLGQFLNKILDFYYFLTIVKLTTFFGGEQFTKFSISQN